MAGNRRFNFSFSQVGIPIGAKLIYTPSNIEVTAATDNKIEFQGRQYSLSEFHYYYGNPVGSNFMHAATGTAYFTYNGVKLSDLQEKLSD